MRTSALVRMSAVLSAAMLALTLLQAGSASADTTPLPAVVADTISLYPGQAAEINVLANDSSPAGGTLALCRFPEVDLDGPLPAVMAMEMPSILDGAAGDVIVSSMPRARGTHVVDYYVCDHAHLVPATLTVVIKDVQPVHVTKVRGKPGRLKVVNHNAEPIGFWYGHPRAERPDGRVRIAPGGTATVRVQRHRILWVALIGAGPGKAAALSSPGIAGHGVVRDIKLNGEPLPAPKAPAPEDLPGDLEDVLGRWR